MLIRFKPCQGVDHGAFLMPANSEFEGGGTLRLDHILPFETGTNWDRWYPSDTHTQLSAFAQLPTFRVTDTIASMADYDPDDKWQNEWMGTVDRVGETLREQHLSNPWPHIPVLPEAMKYMATELWDRGFSQTEIRDAFEAAIRELPPYAAGYETRP